MSIKSDTWITEMAEKHDMISPFVSSQVKESQGQKGRPRRRTHIPKESRQTGHTGLGYNLCGPDEPSHVLLRDARFLSID